MLTIFYVERPQDIPFNDAQALLGVAKVYLFNGTPEHLVKITQSNIQIAPD
jgi:hypothetical protein